MCKELLERHLLRNTNILGQFDVETSLSLMRPEDQAKKDHKVLEKKKILKRFLEDWLNILWIKDSCR